MLSVTEILRIVGIIDVSAKWFTDYARDRGTAVHQATQYLDEGCLEQNSVDDAIIGKFETYKRFKDETDLEILAIEEEVENPEFDYVGHVDRRVKINGDEGVLDIKPAPASWHGLQLAAYAACYIRPMRRWNLYLTDDQYKLVPSLSREDWRTFQAAATVAQWIRRHN